MDWINPYYHPRGTICVLRCNGPRMFALKLSSQRSWPEWAGAFSLL